MRVYRALIVVAALAAAMLLPSTVSATVFQDTTCSGYLVPNATACLYEDGSQGGDNVLVLQNSSISSLLINVTTGDRSCNPNFGQPSTWNDCVSSAVVELGPGWNACWYYDINYSALMFETSNSDSVAHVYPISFPGGYNDNLSSVKFTQGSC